MDDLSLTPAQPTASGDTAGKRYTLIGADGRSYLSEAKGTFGGHRRMRVDSPTSRMRYRITCNRRGGRYTGTVYCQGPGDTGIWTRFSALI